MEKPACRNVVDMHCDTISALYKKRKNGEAAGLLQNDCHVDLMKLQQGNYLLQNFALFVKLSTEKNPWDEVQDLLQIYQEELKKNEKILAPVLTYADIEKNRQKKKLSALLTVEEGGVTNGEIKKLESLYFQGVRMMTLSWNFENGISFPNLSYEKGAKLRKELLTMSKNDGELAFLGYFNTPETKRGLTDRGREFVTKMEEMGMIIDVSHLSDMGFYEVAEFTKKPFVASHSNARSICPCVRNLTDNMIRLLGERGGVTGLNFCADFLHQCSPMEHNPGTIEDIVRHAKHIIKLGGEECLGLGSDFDGIDTHEELPDAGHMALLWDRMHRNGFTERQLDKIFSENVLRVYKEILVS